MEITKDPPEAKSKPNKPLPKRLSSLKKIHVETARQLSALKERANKKPFGRKIRDGEIIALGLKLIEQKHLVDLQEQTYSEKDRLLMAHETYQKLNGKITVDQFIGRLIRGEIQIPKND